MRLIWRSHISALFCADTFLFGNACHSNWGRSTPVFLFPPFGNASSLLHSIVISMFWVGFATRFLQLFDCNYNNKLCSPIKLRNIKVSTCVRSACLQIKGLLLANKLFSWLLLCHWLKITFNIFWIRLRQAMIICNQSFRNMKPTCIVIVWCNSFSTSSKSCLHFVFDVCDM